MNYIMVKKLSELDIRKDERYKVINEFIQSGNLKTCTGCGKYFDKYMYRTRKCKECFKEYTAHKYVESKQNTQPDQ